MASSVPNPVALSPTPSQKGASAFSFIKTIFSLGIRRKQTAEVRPPTPISSAINTTILPPRRETSLQDVKRWSSSPPKISVSRRSTSLLEAKSVWSKDDPQQDPETNPSAKLSKSLKQRVKKSTSWHSFSSENNNTIMKSKLSFSDSTDFERRMLETLGDTDILTSSSSMLSGTDQREKKTRDSGVFDIDLVQEPLSMKTSTSSDLSRDGSLEERSRSAIDAERLETVLSEKEILAFSKPWSATDKDVTEVFSNNPRTSPNPYQHFKRPGSEDSNRSKMGPKEGESFPQYIDRVSMKKLGDPGRPLYQQVQISNVIEQVHFLQYVYCQF
ncbi:hypothetical protein BDR26DRAFT_848698 [Obelidium mucronatum]|nr:hypothetical protein BDR26DRAFT_848698 [Obelidium mucronatum]